MHCWMGILKRESRSEIAGTTVHVFETITGFLLRTSGVFPDITLGNIQHEQRQ